VICLCSAVNLWPDCYVARLTGEALLRANAFEPRTSCLNGVLISCLSRSGYANARVERLMSKARAPTGKLRISVASARYAFVDSQRSRLSPSQTTLSAHLQNCNEISRSSRELDRSMCNSNGPSQSNPGAQKPREAKHLLLLLLLLLLRGKDETPEQMYPCRWATRGIIRSHR
jgi:hypothetical protein